VIWQCHRNSPDWRVVACCINWCLYSSTMVNLQNRPEFPLPDLSSLRLSDPISRISYEKDSSPDKPDDAAFRGSHDKSNEEMPTSDPPDQLKPWSDDPDSTSPYKLVNVFSARVESLIHLPFDSYLSVASFQHHSLARPKKLASAIIPPRCLFPLGYVLNSNSLAWTGLRSLGNWHVCRKAYFVEVNCCRLGRGVCGLWWHKGAVHFQN
jgi:hypothetical protein